MLVAADIPLPGIKDTLGERILPVEDVLTLLKAADKPKRPGPFTKRNATFLRLLYSACMRVSEACGLRWEAYSPHSGRWRVSSWLVPLSRDPAVLASGRTEFAVSARPCSL